MRLDAHVAWVAVKVWIGEPRSVEYRSSRAYYRGIKNESRYQESNKIPLLSGSTLGLRGADDAPVVYMRSRISFAMV